MSSSLIAKFSEKFSIEPSKMMAALQATAFKQSNGRAITNEQMMSLLVVADQYNLNPWTKEIYAFPTKGGGIVPIVGVDGWCRIINENPQFDGMEFSQSDVMVDPVEGKRCPEWIQCTIYRKDRNKPTSVKEYLDEVYKDPIKKNGDKGPYTISGPWQTHTKRFLRHKAMIQASRLTFGYTGFYDQDEGERIVEAERVVEGEVVSNSNRGENIDDSPVVDAKVDAAVNFFKEIINKDDMENHLTVKDTWSRLNNNEKFEVENKLTDKAQDSKRMYKSILRQYISHQPE